MKEKLKSYSFWVGLISAIMVLLRTISTQINVEYIDEIMTALLGVFAVTGIVSKPSKKTEEGDIDNQNKEKNIE